MSRRRDWSLTLLRRTLKMGSLYNRGYANYRNICQKEEIWSIPELPASEVRIIQISDLHLDLDPTMIPLIRERLTTVEGDLLVITGDFADRMKATNEVVAGLAKQLLADLPFPVAAIPGNHDTFSLLAVLDSAGIPVLFNERGFLECGNGRIQISGIDDPHAYSCWEIPPLEVPVGILLCHSPAIAPITARAGYHLMLSGHTHGGQICLPGGWGPYHATGLPKDLILGRWRRGELQGYTHPGTGACQLPIRFNCPPEVTVHILKPAD